MNKKEKIMIIPQTLSRLSPIHHHRVIYFYNMDYYEIEKNYTVTP